MNRPIEQAFLSLLPTQNSVLPPPLIELARSLLAQSRHRATILKAEEEIARPYACAHIACDRLKTSLNLPPIEPHPPIPPRLYKRLYTHLDKILASSAPAGPTTPRSESRIGTPSTKLHAAATTPGASPLANKSRVTPSKEKSLSQFRSGLHTKTNGTPKAVSTPDGLFPPWVRPVLRFLCAELGPSRIGPVVMSGVESVVAPGGRRTDDTWVNGNLVPLLAALYLYVWRGVVLQGEEVGAAEYARFRGKLLRSMLQAREVVEVKWSRVGEGHDNEMDPWDGWRDVKVKDVDTAMLRMNRHGFLEMDWVAGIDDLAKMETRETHGGDNKAVDDTTSGLGQVKRADTMFQEKYDYLNDRRKKEFTAWKQGMLRRIRASGTGRPGHDDAMDLDG